MINSHLVFQHQISSLMVSRAKGHFWSDDNFVQVFFFNLMKLCANQTLIFYENRFYILFPFFIPVLLLHFIAKKYERRYMSVFSQDRIQQVSVEFFPFSISLESVVRFQESIKAGLSNFGHENLRKLGVANHLKPGIIH